MRRVANGNFPGTYDEWIYLYGTVERCDIVREYEQTTLPDNVPDLVLSYFDRIRNRIRNQIRIRAEHNWSLGTDLKFRICIPYFYT